jgi:hypothetical protein
VNRSELNDDLSSFEEELRAWGGRPPRIPAAIARGRVMARLPLAGGPLPWLRLAGVAALLLVLVVATWLGTPGAERGSASVARGDLGEAVDPNVVVWVVDARTTVYFVLGPDGPAKGGVS